MIDKEKKLKEFFSCNPNPAVCYSGGVDSVYLLYAAKKYGIGARAYFVKTPFQPKAEVDDAVKAANEIDAELKIIPFDILSIPNISANTPERCYYCKREILSIICSAAAKDGHTLIVDGTNFSDLSDDRPGMRALAELGVISPLRECGLTKEDIRALSQKAGLFTWNKPSYSCLATRIPHGISLNLELLKNTEAAEYELSQLGFTDFRCRYFNGAAKLEIKTCEMERAFLMRDKIIKSIGRYYDSVLLDLKGR